MPQLPAPHQRTPHRHSHTRTRKNGSTPRKPARQITRKLRIPLRRQLVCPKVLASGIGHCTRQLAQRDAHARRNQRNQNDAVDDEQRASGIDARDHGRRDAEPGIGEGEADAEDGPNGEVALHVLRVAHFGQLQGVLVERGVLGADLGMGLFFGIGVGHGRVTGLKLG